MAAIDLLNRRADEFNPVEVLTILPSTWALKAIEPALIKLTRASMHKVIKVASFHKICCTFFFSLQKRMMQIEKGLSQSVNTSAKLELIQLTKEPIYLNENRYFNHTTTDGATRVYLK